MIDRVAAAAIILTLSACGESDDPASANQAPPRTETSRAEMEFEEPDRREPLPLRPGVYVQDGIACDNPPNAGFRIWNGKGLSGSATRACRSSTTKVGPIDYRVENSCENTYDGSRTTAQFEIAIPGPERFDMDGMSYLRCTDGAAPAALERLVRASSK
ncbi:hypothetical protein WJT74_00940 [Sphingomicrobium sp. XHP0239]|uniref:hypothetical protein n=1 Tax=Sphingomicrobium maritimum TaxID=3133972 RepID=UPI0031CC6749